ncbi:transglutaminase-like domain-containing protein [Sulfurovum indicum]|uniref:transglutaminase-like domain-containing protein n=1 Tax=Sulfurovum indicum TaxID=2779528 RepID=UPI001E335209|nr:transglutaminase-like domain-containing protein [Sulfurovum indicum]
MPLHNMYQKVKFFKYSGNFDASHINRKNIYDAQILYAQWHASDTSKQLTIEMEIETLDRSVSLKKIKKASQANLPVPEDVRLYLQPTTHIPTDGKVALKTMEITKGITDRFQKVEAIYNWITETTFRDPSIVGCGVGHAGKMIESGYFGGKCTDISSLFVAFLRSAGIPAREVFGIRVGKSHFSKILGKSDKHGFADISTWQHCRVEYYIPGAGWIPSDPADITKLELGEGLKYSDQRVQELKKRYLHSWEMNWIGFNHGRDFVLYPEPEQYPLNMLGYPYGEIEDEVLDYYSPKHFSYRITSQELGLK